jgi:hypothetical protein
VLKLNGGLKVRSFSVHNRFGPENYAFYSSNMSVTKANLVNFPYGNIDTMNYYFTPIENRFHPQEPVSGSNLFILEDATASRDKICGVQGCAA